MKNQKSDTVVASPLQKLGICCEEDIKRLTIEWDIQEVSDGYRDAYAMIKEKYGDVNTKTVRLGPKVVDFPRVSATISQWVVDIYI